MFFVFLGPAGVDAVVTVIGQGKGYWSNPLLASDASPAYYILAASPWFFVLGSLIWFFLWYLLFQKLKEPLNLFFMFLFIAGHSWGSSSWLMRIFKQMNVYTKSNQLSIIFAWGLLIIYFALIAFVAVYCLRIYLKNRKIDKAFPAAF